MFSFTVLNFFSIFCLIRGKTILDHCPYIIIMAHSWYPQQINGHIFYGKDGDFIRIPEHLLEISASTHSEDKTCWFIQFTEYSSQQWFITGDKGTALKNKVWLIIVVIDWIDGFYVSSRKCWDTYVGLPIISHPSTELSFTCYGYRFGVSSF